MSQGHVRLEMNESLVQSAPAPRSNKRVTILAGVGALLVIAALCAALVFVSKESATSSPNLMGEPMAAPTQGSVNVYGRAYSYQITASVAGLETRYSARVRDETTGVETSVYGYKTSQDALEYGIEQTFGEMQTKGLVQDPSDAQRQFIMTVPTSEESGADDETAMPNSGKSGDIDVMGRRIHWKASAYRHKLSLRYKATATDVATGISFNAKGYKSGKGAVEHAVEGLVKDLIAKGIIVVPGVATEYNFVPAGVTADEETPISLGKSGDVSVCGRPIHWSASGYYKFPLSIRYKCTAKDTGSGISASVKGFKKGEAACKQAITDVLTKDAQQGVPLNPADNCGTQSALTTGYSTFGGAMVVSAEVPMGEEETEVTLGASKSGEVEVYGRKLKWNAKGYVKGLTWKYKATARDIASGVEGSSKGYKSGKGAVEAAVKDCFKKMIEKGIIPPPPSLAITMAEVVLEDIEDGSQSENDIDLAKDQAEIAQYPFVEGGMAAMLAENDRDANSWEDLIYPADPEAPVQDEPLTLGLFSKEGDTVVYGRTIHYKASGYVKGIHWRYKATARDVASGVTAGASGHKSGEGAVKEAITNVFKALDAAGIFPPRA